MRGLLRASMLFFCVVFFSWPVFSDKIITDDSPNLSSRLMDQAKAETNQGLSALLESARSADASMASAGADSDVLILINKHHKLPADYVPSDLVTVESTTPAAIGQQMSQPAAEAFEQLAAAAKEEEHTIKLVSGYRSYETQERLYESYLIRDGSYASRYSALPGHSEHQTGLAADVSSPSVEYDLVEAYGSTKEGIWLADNAHRFGFILRYGEGEENITGYIYEPWHIRYVGVDAATEIYKKNLTLEEYLDSY